MGVSSAVDKPQNNPVDKPNIKPICCIVNGRNFYDVIPGDILHRVLMFSHPRELGLSFSLVSKKWAHIGAGAQRHIHADKIQSLLDFFVSKSPKDSKRWKDEIKNSEAEKYCKKLIAENQVEQLRNGNKLKEMIGTVRGIVLEIQGKLSNLNQNMATYIKWSMGKDPEYSNFNRKIPYPLLIRTALNAAVCPPPAWLITPLVNLKLLKYTSIYELKKYGIFEHKLAILIKEKKYDQLIREIDNKAIQKMTKGLNDLDPSSCIRPGEEMIEVMAYGIESLCLESNFDLAYHLAELVNKKLTIFDSSERYYIIIRHALIQQKFEKAAEFFMRSLASIANLERKKRVIQTNTFICYRGVKIAYRHLHRLILSGEFKDYSTFFEQISIRLERDEKLILLLAKAYQEGNIYHKEDLFKFLQLLSRDVQEKVMKKYYELGLPKNRAKVYYFPYKAIE